MLMAMLSVNQRPDTVAATSQQLSAWQPVVHQGGFTKPHGQVGKAHVAYTMPQPGIAITFA